MKTQKRSYRKLFKDTNKTLNLGTTFNDKIIY